MDSNVFKILGLPDEMIMEIFSYINYIPAKLELEQVCRQFRSLGGRSPSWKSIRKLEIMINCFQNEGIVSLTGDCTKSEGSTTLNGVKVSVNNWPRAIESLLKRAQIDQLLIHVGSWPHVGLTFFGSNQHLDIAEPLLDVFQRYSSKLSLNLFELHSCNDSPILEPIFFHCLEHYAESLEKVTIVAERTVFIANRSDKIESFFTLVWPLVSSCQHLKSFGYSTDGFLPGNESTVDALVGKPLRELKIGGGEYDYYSFLTPDNLAQIINSTTGQGIETLALKNFGSGYETLTLKQLCDLLSEKARKKLKQLTILDYRDAGDGLIFKDLHLLPSMFPSLEKIDIYGGHWGGASVDLDIEACITRFYEIAHNSTPVRIVTFQRLYCEAIDTFKTDLTAFCQGSDIDVHFGGVSEPWATLSKGNATVIILKAMTASGESEDFDEDLDDFDQDEGWGWDEFDQGDDHEHELELWYNGDLY